MFQKQKETQKKVDSYKKKKKIRHISNIFQIMATQ